jgi:hypothetical protein
MNPSTDPYEPIAPSGIGIQDPNVRDVAGESGIQRWAGQLLTMMANPTAGEDLAMGGLGGMAGQVGKRVQGSQIMGDPAMKAAMNAFQTFEQPVLEDRASSMGMGRSTGLLDDISMGASSMMLPQIQAAQAREERGIERDTGIFGNIASQGTALGGLEADRLAGTQAAAASMGDTQRGIEQERRDAYYDDFLRRSALGENVLMGPFGGLVPSTIGSRVSQSGGGKK